MEKLKIDNRAYSVRDYHLGWVGKGLEAVGACIEPLESLPKWWWVTAGFLLGYLFKWTVIGF